MTLYRFIKYDIAEGIIKFWYKYIVVVIISIVLCFAGDAYFSNGTVGYSHHPNVTSFHAYIFYGRLPYDFMNSGGQSFFIPYEWLILNILMSFVIGDYIESDLKGYGKLLIIQSGKRIFWWMSKLVWCVLTNIFFFLCVLMTEMGYLWIKYGEVGFANQRIYLMRLVNDFVSEGFGNRTYIIIFLMPILSTVVCSIIQISASLIAGSEISFLILCTLYAASAYYSNPLIPCEYSMMARYGQNMNQLGINPANVRFGTNYLLCAGAILSVLTYNRLIRKRDIF